MERFFNIIHKLRFIADMPAVRRGFPKIIPDALRVGSISYQMIQLSVFHAFGNDPIGFIFIAFDLRNISEDGDSSAVSRTSRAATTDFALALKQST